MAKSITLLGSTGSIGTQSLDVARAQGYRVFGLAANRQVELLARQIAEFHPRYAAVADPDAYDKLEAMLAGNAGARPYADWLDAFCRRKYNSDFSREMSRSMAVYLEPFRP